jgi:hypothetical protein
MNGVGWGGELLTLCHGGCGWGAWARVRQGAAALTTPFDVAKTRRQLAQSAVPVRLSTVLREILAHSGWPGLFRGMRAHPCPHACLPLARLTGASVG